MNLRELMRKEVRVVGGGVAYAGVLIEATEEALLLKTDNGFVSVATDRVTSVQPKDGVQETGLSGANVSRSFYEFDPSE